MVHAGTLEALQSQPGPSRRDRPPDINVEAADENRVPLRSEKASWRESRLGFRNMFGRSKTVKDSEAPSSPREVASSAGARTSVADMSNLPYGRTILEFEPTPTASRSFRPLSTMAEAPPSSEIASPESSASHGKQRAVSGKLTRGPMGSWHLPPLFKAFPQSIKYITLPATSIHADIILRAHDKGANVVPQEDSTETPSSTMDGTDRSAEKEKTKKKHRRNVSTSGVRFEWVNKTYVLTTSGYLLQYTGEGVFDRLPEKVLHLGKNSAAFVSDVLPGRHWVVQVASVMESDGTTSTDSRSLFSRLPFRPTERRQASNFLMVFETAEDMEGWIGTLRREIEALGGKKALSETGTPKEEDDAGQLRPQPSQRTLVVRDPERLTRIGSQQASWQNLEAADSSSALVTDLDANTDQSVDDVSTTNSFVSQDGRQLDSLRDSTNRLSLASSGQRTIVTSAASSPECSPTADTFPTRFDDRPQEERSPEPQARLRPNAAAISIRRKSMQNMSPFVEFKAGVMSVRPQSSYGPDMHSSKAPTPNFSVPHSSNRRFSYARTTPLEFNAPNQPAMGGVELYPRASVRKGPPTALSLARPLSMVADYPSPMEEMQPRPATRHGDDTQPLSISQHDLNALPRIPTSYRVPLQRSSFMPPESIQVEVNRATGSRRLSGMRPWRRSENPIPIVSDMTTPTRPPPPSRMRSHSGMPAQEEPTRRRPSLDLRGSALSDSSSVKSRSMRRASVQSCLSDRASQHSRELPAPFDVDSLPSPLPPPSMPLPPIPNSASNPQLRADVKARALLNRRSMPQLSEGPPPLPPPTCALPPLPQKASSVKMESVI